MALQAVGLVGLIAFGVFWAYTDRLSPTLLAAVPVRLPPIRYRWP